MLLKNKLAALFWGNKKTSKSTTNSNESDSQELRRERVIETSQRTLAQIKQFVHEAIVLIDSSENLEIEEEQKIKAELNKDIDKIRTYISTLKKLGNSLNNNLDTKKEGTLSFSSQLNSLPNLFLGTHFSIKVYRQRLLEFKKVIDNIEI